VHKRPLIIPSETQSREFDAKLLLGAVAAERGFPVIVGSRTEMHLRIASLPRGVYVANNIRKSSERIFRIMENLGFEMVAWDEEGLVTYSPGYYLEKRVSDEALGRTSHVFAWGAEHAEVFRTHPKYSGVPIHVTGNPRVDIMRPEFLPYFQDEVNRITARYGRFILINTNFSTLNHYVPNLSAAVPGAWSQDLPGQVDFNAGLIVHRYKIFPSFLVLVPRLAERFPSVNIVVRPHVAENHEPWLAAAAGHENIRVVHEGNVVPWILASAALVHNGCTTAVEAFVLRKPAVTYRPVIDERFETRLPNELSYPARDVAGLCDTLSRILDGELGPCDGQQHWLCANHNIAALDGPLASDRIMDVLENIEPRSPHGGAPGIVGYVRGWLQATLRARSKRANAEKAGHKNSAEYQRQRFPGLTLAEVRSRFDSLSRQTGRFTGLQVEELETNIFRIVPRVPRV
jgi:surface carbohydrate biosynthesis protein